MHLLIGSTIVWMMLPSIYTQENIWLIQQKLSWINQQIYLLYRNNQIFG